MEKQNGKNSLETWEWSPPNIEEILNAPCPFWPDRRVKETHLLTLIPETVKGKHFCLNTLREIIQTPKFGFATKYENEDDYDDMVKEEQGAISPIESYWVLTTRDVIPGSRKLPQKFRSAAVPESVFMKECAKKSGAPYLLPTALEAATAILTHHVETGEKLYPDDPWTIPVSTSGLYASGRCWTVCQEKIDHRHPMTVGLFSASGLGISISQGVSIFQGACAARKFREPVYGWVWMKGQSYSRTTGLQATVHEWTAEYGDKYKEYCAGNLHRSIDDLSCILSKSDNAKLHDGDVIVFDHDRGTGAYFVRFSWQLRVPSLFAHSSCRIDEVKQVAEGVATEGKFETEIPKFFQPLIVCGFFDCVPPLTPW